MTRELNNILGSLKAEIDNFNAGVVTNEKEFIGNLKLINKELTDELEKQEPEKTQLSI